MAECFKCGRDMTQVAGCDDNRTIDFADGEEMEPVPFGEADSDPDEMAGRVCHDCGVGPGEYHHPGCDAEECPRCGGQYFVCECVTDEKNEIWGTA